VRGAARRLPEARLVAILDGARGAREPRRYVLSALRQALEGDSGR
jgi:hypothetical protein